MSDFSLTTHFVLPTTVTPATVPSYQLLPGQFGIYKDDYTYADAAGVVGAKYIYLKQGRLVWEPGLPTKTSDRIYADSILEWYKVPANTGFSNQITEISNWVAQCDNTYSVTLRLFSNYTGVGFYNGMTRSITVKAPCCACGADPCANLAATDIQNLVDAFVAGINKDTLLKKLVYAERMGSGATSVLRITGLALPTPQKRQNPGVNRFQFDRLYFFAWAYEGVPTTQDPELYYDRCSPVATANVIQRALWPKGTSDGVREIEKQYYSYQTLFKDQFKDSDWNNTFQSAVVDGTFYDMYYLKYKQKQQRLTWDQVQPIDEAAIIHVPTGLGANLEGILTAFLGAPAVKSSPNPSTTTTAATTTLATTTTTTMIP